MKHNINLTNEITATIQRDGSEFTVQLRQGENEPFFSDNFKGSESLSTVVKYCEHQAENYQFEEKIND